MHKTKCVIVGFDLIWTHHLVWDKSRFIEWKLKMIDVLIGDQIEELEKKT